MDFFYTKLTWHMKDTNKYLLTPGSSLKDKYINLLGTQ
jgi:hypothetical protein